MNKSLLVIVGLVLLVGGGYFFVQSQKSPETTTPQTSMEKTQSRYMPYSKAAFEASRGKKRVYFFFAPWCPTCVPTDKEFQANLGKIPEDIVLFRTDYDSSTELKKQYGITYQHTFVQVDEDGNAVKKWNGGGIEELIANTR